MDWTNWVPGWLASAKNPREPRASGTAASDSSAIALATAPSSGLEGSALTTITADVQASVTQMAAGLEMRRIDGRSASDAEAFQRFVLQASADYRWQVQGRLPMLQDVDRILNYRPQGVPAERKYVWGVWKGPHLVGCLEVLRGWPSADCLYIGLLLIEPGSQGKGLGRRVLAMLSERTKAWGQIKRWRISVVKNQGGALRFWRKQGFHPTGESQDASFVAPLLNMERRLHH